jgi:hypothetical protein
MKQTAFEIEVPFFCGFYESVLLNSDTLYNELHDMGLDYYQEHFNDNTLTFDDLDLDYEEYKKDCCVEFIKAFLEQEEVPSFVEDIEFLELVSPKFYNYSTDKLYAKLSVMPDWRNKVLEFMRDNKEWVSNMLEKDFKRRSGFMSFYSDTFEEWYNVFSTKEDDDIDAIYAGTIIKYMMLCQNKEVWENILLDTLENIYVNDYIKVIK